ncbi:TonB-linked outer membrane protein, SusC/RagA family [Arenibacter nanhaiticus]|uniref:TonB-linked outer membrane protein, SusC/RagA family n=1 Tax=Arenibacter nanhaiticus TaxID=558155 RepID=A0A1M6BZE5_9FLAO|nr:TonB-dependent receptor [Arenibacter nanhaiticus]SHI54179.1 TonB-linked outer membrane protein, SusC/RagA family [Arenibacter nanhaiticus]
MKKLLKQECHSIGIPKFNLKVKLTTFLFLVVLMQSQANSYSQNTKISLNLNDVTIQSVLDEIESKTKFKFFVDTDIIDLAKKVSVTEKEKRISNVLEKLFEGTNIVFKVVGKQIVLKPDPSKIITPQIPNNSKSEIELPQKTISGTVTDEENIPLSGASIVIKGSTTGVAADFDGNFSIQASMGDILDVSYIGYNSKEVKVTNQTELTIVLTASNELDEVVVVGYGSKKRTDITGSIASVSVEKEIGKRPVANINQMLQGNVANFNVSVGSNGGEPGAAVNLNIRGSGTLTGNGGQPYVLLDGLPIDVSDMNAINPYDVEDVTVLKDAAAAAIYGSRGAFGVILITTKKGKKGKVQVEYSNNVATSKPTNLPKIANSIEWAKAYNDGASNDGSAPVFTEDELQDILDYRAGVLTVDTAPAVGSDSWRTYHDGFADYNWYDVIFKDSAPRQQHRLSISGGGEKSKFYVSGNYFEQLGNMNFANEQYGRYNFTFNFETEATDWLKFDISTKYSLEEQRLPSGGFAGFNKDVLYHQIARMWPMMPLYYPDDPDRILNLDILRIRDSGHDIDITGNTILQGGVEIEPIENWITRVRYNYSVRNFKNERLELRNFIVQPSGRQQNIGHSLDEISRFFSERKTQVLNATSNYKLAVENHNIDVLVGAESRLTENIGLFGRGSQLITTNVPTLSTVVGDEVASDNLSHFATRGFFTSISYNYDEKYFVEGKIRIDESSYFSEGKRKGAFPGISAGYIISNEDFWSPLKNTVNYLKLRGSWGQLGNHDPDLANRFVELMGTGLSSYLINGVRPNIVTAPGLISPDLTWETVTSYNFGFDAALFNNKLNLSLEGFNRTTSDMIGPALALPTALGTAAPVENNAELETKGWEFSAKYQDNVGDFTYGIGVNIGDNQSKVTKYTNPTGILSTWYEGRKLGEIWGFETVGIFQSQEEADNAPDQSRYWSSWGAGDIQYADLDGNGAIEPGANTLEDHGDLKIIGNSTPRYNYGVNLSAGYKGFDLSVLIQGVAKRDIMFSNNTNLFWGYRGSFWQNSITKASLDYWTPENTDAYFPKPYINSQHSKNTRAQTRYLQDASYTRIKNIQLSYSFPSSITSKMGLSKFQLFFSGDNLVTWTKLNENFDPEATAGGFGGGKVYPLQKVLSLGVNIGI